MQLKNASHVTIILFEAMLASFLWLNTDSPSEPERSLHAHSDSDGAVAISIYVVYNAYVGCFASRSQLTGSPESYDVMSSGLGRETIRLRFDVRRFGSGSHRASVGSAPKAEKFLSVASNVDLRLKVELGD